MTKFSVVLPDGSVHTVDGSLLRVEFDGGVQDIPFSEVTEILATVNAGQQISAQMALIESIGDIGPVQEDELDELDEKLSEVISRLFGMPEGDNSCQHDCDHCTSCHSDDADPIAEVLDAYSEATIIQFPSK